MRLASAMPCGFRRAKEEAALESAGVTSLPLLRQPDCTTFPCKEDCCSAGVDVFADERQRMIDDGIATAADFNGSDPEEEEKLYLTALEPRYCVFLEPTRG